MFEKRYLHAVDELGNLIHVVEYLSKYASGTFRTNFEQPLVYYRVWWIT
jgi:hypothetical protein